jgi:transketolase N-terminal domain/subunit
MGELDRRAIDTVRVLAMDAVQKAGNGHPGTAMSVGPTAYLLFQKWLRHDPGDPDWAGRDRFVLSMGHSSLTPYIQLFLSGYGLELSDLEALRTWGPGRRAIPRSTTRRVWKRRPARWARALATPSAWRWPPAASAACWIPMPPRARACSTTRSGRSPRTATWRRVSAARRRRLAGTQELGNLVLVYDANRISIENNTGIAFTEDVVTRYEAYGWHVQRVDDGEDLVAVDRALGAAQAETGRPSLIVLRTIIGWPSPNKQNTGAAHGSALGEDEVRTTKDNLGFDPGRTFEVAPEVLEHARLVAIRGKQAHARWQQRFDAWRAGNPGGGALLERLSTRTLPQGWADTLPAWDADPSGLATRKPSGEVLAALYPVLPELDGPTHQPIEHYAALRAIPGLDFVRPGDANETAVAWRTILEHNDRPAGLSLSRQNLPVLDRTEFASAEGVARGGTCWLTPPAAPRGHPDWHGLRGADRRRRPPGAGGRRRPGEGRLAAVLGVVRGPGPGLPRAGAAAHGARPGERRGRCAHGLAGVRRRRWPDRRPGPLRRQRGLHRAVRAVRLTADAVVAAARESLAAAGAPSAAPTGPGSAGVLHSPTGDR